MTTIQDTAYMDDDELRAVTMDGFLTNLLESLEAVPRL